MGWRKPDVKFDLRNSQFSNSALTQISSYVCDQACKNQPSSHIKLPYFFNFVFS